MAPTAERHLTLRVAALQAWRWAIPGLWAFSVVEAIRGGFHPGLPPPGMVGQPAAYPWIGVLITCLITGFEMRVVYLILRPLSFAWSLRRAATALAVSMFFSLFHLLITATDLPGYRYVAPAFSLLFTALLFGLFLTIVAFALARRRAMSGSSPNHAA